jgi:AcrR family transcriptional regulator
VSTGDAKTKAPRKTLRNKKRELYRAAVLDAAERVFSQVGYDATKVQRVAAEAGVSLTTLYAVFESKWEIYRGVYRRRLNEVMARAAAVVQEGRPAIDTLVTGFRAQLLFFMEHPDFLRMQLKDVTAWSATELLRSPEQVEAMAVGNQLFMTVFEAAMRDGYLIEDDPELMVRTAIAAQQVRLGLWMERGMKEAPAVVADAALRHLLRSYCRPEQLNTVLEQSGLREVS